MNLLKFMIRWICRFLLFLSGITEIGSIAKSWKNLLDNRKKIVVIFPHTSLWDSAFFIIVSLAYELPMSALLHHNWIDMPIVGWFLKQTHFIPILPQIDGGQGGLVMQVSNVLNKRTDGFVLFVSPTGQRTKREWRTGFYQIAKHTGAKIIIAGLDYLRHEMRFNEEEFDPSILSYEELTAQISPYFKAFTPLYPEESLPQPQIIDNFPNWRDVYILTPFKTARLYTLFFMICLVCFQITSLYSPFSFCWIISSSIVFYNLAYWKF